LRYYGANATSNLTYPHYVSANNGDDHGETSNPRSLRQTGRRAVDALRTATEPMRAREIAERVLVAANITKPDKAALADLIGTVLASLRNHAGKGIQRANEGSPAKWRLAPT
jgi:hypothetical protein